MFVLSGDVFGLGGTAAAKDQRSSSETDECQRGWLWHRLERNQAVGTHTDRSFIGAGAQVACDLAAHGITSEDAIEIEGELGRARFAEATKAAS